ncbi:MAG TPA: biosynthetic peptidoglycan transglycosylase, partial [Bradyrhizobium sp.]|nr:biosynthetic peptidoglycan transglycosylase [Bradyrhizobium sp.]
MAQIRDSLRTLARQIAVLVRDAGRRAQAWWMARAAALRASGTSFGDRWPAWQARLQSSAQSARWPGLDLNSKWTGWRQRVMPAAWRNPGALKAGAKYLAAAFGLALCVLIGFVLYSIATLPIGGGLQAEATQSALTFEGAQGDVFAARGVFKGDRLTAADLPPHLAQAIVAIEDRRFYQHYGIDLRGILRAGWRNTQAGATREGASTITQQLARLMFLSPERTFRRKIQEAVLALWLESQLKKEDILLRYLN